MKKISLFFGIILVVSLINLLIVSYIKRVNEQSNYQSAIENFNIIKSTDVHAVSQPAILYVGRESCRFCVDFVTLFSKENEGRSPKNLFYIDSENIQTDQELSKFFLENNILAVPTIIYWNNNQLSSLSVPRSSLEMKQFINDLIEY